MKPERHQPFGQVTAQRDVAGVDPEAETQRLRQRLNRLEAEWQEIRTRYYGELGDPAESDPRQSDVVYISPPDELTIFLLPALIGVYLVVVIQWLAARLTGSLEDTQEQDFMAARVRYLRERVSLENQLTALGQSPRGDRTDDGH